MEVLLLIDFFPAVRRLCHLVRQLALAVNMMSIKNFWRDSDGGNPKYLGKHKDYVCFS